MSTDKNIWDDFRQGNKYALSHIYYQNVNLLYRYGLKFTSDRSFIKDTIQDLFFDLIRTRQNLGPTDNIRFYLMRSFRRRLVKAMGRVPIAEGAGGDGTQPVIVYSVEEEFIGRETLTRQELFIRECLEELNPRQREIIYYRFTCNLGYDEICDLMSLKYDSARKLMHRALESLKKIAGEHNILHLLVMTFSLKDTNLQRRTGIL